jgi:hypothetical protein
MWTDSSGFLIQETRKDEYPAARWAKYRGVIAVNI